MIMIGLFGVRELTTIKKKDLSFLFCKCGCMFFNVVFLSLLNLSVHMIAAVISIAINFTDGAAISPTHGDFT